MRLCFLLKPITVVCLWLGICYPSFSITSSGDSDSTLKCLLKSDIGFHSDLEERVMKKLFAGEEVSLLEMMLATDKYTLLSDYEKINEKVEVFIEKMKHETKTLTLQSKVRLVFQRTHTAFLKKYESGVMMSDLFINGHYNCVTGTALYAHVFKCMGIPYQIKETPDHVYLIVDPGKSNIPVESTDPMHGSMKPSSNVIKDYVKYLIESKQITQDELDSNGMEATFIKHWYSKTDINDKELAALQYSNLTLKSYNDKYTRFDVSFQFAQKSLYLYPSDQMKFLFSVFCFFYIGEYTYINPACIHAYLEAYYCSSEKVRSSIYADEFKNIKNQVLTSRGDTALFREYYQAIRTFIPQDSILRYKTWYLFHYEKARYALEKEDYTTALRYSCAASTIEPKNIELKQMIELAILKQAITMSDPEKVILMLNEICLSYGFVKRYKLVQNMYGFNYLCLANQYFEVNRKEEAVSLVEDVEDFPGATLDPQLVSKVFIKATDAYLSVNNRRKARQCLTKGIQYAPSDKAMSDKLKKMDM